MPRFARQLCWKGAIVLPLSHLSSKFLLHNFSIYGALCFKPSSLMMIGKLSNSSFPYSSASTNDLTTEEYFNSTKPEPDLDLTNDQPNDRVITRAPHHHSCHRWAEIWKEVQFWEVAIPFAVFFFNFSPKR